MCPGMGRGQFRAMPSMDPRGWSSFSCTTGLHSLWSWKRSHVYRLRLKKIQERGQPPEAVSSQLEGPGGNKVKAIEQAFWNIL